MVGLCALLHQNLRWWGLIAGVAYAYAFVFFTSTVVWALVAHTPNWQTLGEDFGWWLTVHGAVMVVGGVGFGLGLGLLHADGYVPRWTVMARSIRAGTPERRVRSRIDRSEGGRCLPLRAADR